MAQNAVGYLPSEAGVPATENPPVIVMVCKPGKLVKTKRVRAPCHTGIILCLRSPDPIVWCDHVTRFVQFIQQFRGVDRPFLRLRGAACVIVLVSFYYFCTRYLPRRSRTDPMPLNLAGFLSGRIRLASRSGRRIAASALGESIHKNQSCHG